MMERKKKGTEQNPPTTRRGENVGERRNQDPGGFYKQNYPRSSKTNESGRNSNVKKIGGENQKINSPDKPEVKYEGHSWWV